MARTATPPGLITEYTGEVINFPGTSADGRRARSLQKKYAAAATKLHRAKREAAAVELEMKVLAAGHEVVAVDDETVWTWKFKDSRSFDTVSFKENPWRAKLYARFMKTKRVREFRVVNVTNVDV